MKHENRIRALEAQNKTIQEDVEFLKGDSTPSATLNMRDDGHMAPDEVWGIAKKGSPQSKQC